MTESWDEPPARPSTYAFEEWALYYQSAERVTDRRLAVNSSNFSISIALMAGIGLLGNWSAEHTAFRVFILSGITLVALLGVLFCRLWFGQIRDYKRLNSAKFEVLTYMAPYVRFDGGDRHVSAAPFDREWRRMMGTGGATNIRFFNLVALPSSFQEFVMPGGTMVVFGAVAAMTSALLIANWQPLTRDAFRLPDSPAPKLTVKRSASQDISAASLGAAT
jgi:hypothetical protein